MSSASPGILAINGGSSSIRFAVYEAAAEPRLRLSGRLDRIGLTGTNLLVHDRARMSQTRLPLSTGQRNRATAFLLHWLETQPIFNSVVAAGHRIVHGMGNTSPARITPRLVSQLRRNQPFDPEHLPRELELIAALRRECPRMQQFACFDTAFHRTMPALAKLLPIPRTYAAKGVERYGFHGLSYAYLLEELGRIDPAAVSGRVILAHLGNGCSLAALRHGQSIDTSMGFTPTSGLMMGSRTGDLDPGLAYFLSRTQRMTPSRFQKMVNHESGLLGVSGSSPDLRDLLGREATDSRAAQAIALFCYQARKWIGSFAAALGGLDTLVFAGGIGENAPLIRARICQELGFLGIKLHSSRNVKNAPLISVDGRPVRVRVIRTDEELMIARIVARMIKAPVSKRATSHSSQSP